MKTETAPLRAGKKKGPQPSCASRSAKRFKNKLLAASDAVGNFIVGNLIMAVSKGWADVVAIYLLGMGPKWYCEYTGSECAPMVRLLAPPAPTPNKRRPCGVTTLDSEVRRTYRGHGLALVAPDDAPRPV